MLRKGQAALTRIYSDERSKGDDAPLSTVIVEKARSGGIAGATVLGAAVGFGASKSVQRASILDLSGNILLIIELINEKEKLRRFMSELAGMENIGLVTLEDVEVLHYGGKVQLSA